MPLINRFQALSAQASDSLVDSELADLLQCFNGVALAATTNTACALVGWSFISFIYIFTFFFIWQRLCYD